MDFFIAEIIIIVVFTVLSAFFSGSETALFSLTKGDLYKFSESEKNIERSIARSMASPQNILVTILIGNLFVNLIISAISTRLMLLKWAEFGHFMSIAIVTPIMIVLCEISPKVISINHYESISKKIFPLLKIFHKLFFPVRIVLSLATNVVVKGFNLKLVHKKITHDELGMAINAGEVDGIIEKKEGDFLKNILRFSQKEGSNIMFPRNRTVFIPYNTTINEAMKIFIESEITRAPVYKDNIDNVIGMIDSKELMPFYLGHRKAKNINRFIKTINFYPSSIELNDLLSEFLSNGIQIAIVIDEYGGTAGVVTLNLILAELMGKKFSKLDADPKPDIRLKDGDTSIISGEMQIDDFNYYFNDDLKSTESDTIGGYIIEKLAYFPKRGESLKTDKYLFRVRYIKKNKIETLEVIMKS